MFYEITLSFRPFRKAWAESRDGKIVAASPAMSWAIGKAVGSVLFWCEERGMNWKVFERRKN